MCHVTGEEVMKMSPGAQLKKVLGSDDYSPGTFVDEDNDLSEATNSTTPNGATELLLNQ